MSARDVIADAIRIEAEQDLIAAYDAESVTARILSALAAAGKVIEDDWCHDMAKAPRDGRPVVLIACYPNGVTWSDQYQCWWSQDHWTRWPHPFPPTAWRPLPASPAAKETKQ